MKSYGKIMIAILMLGAALSAFANGQKDGSTVSGTVLSMNTAANGTTIISVGSGGKTYAVTVAQKALNGMDLAVGKVISIKGKERKASDGTTEIEADSVSDGVPHDRAEKSEGAKDHAPEKQAHQDSHSGSPTGKSESPSEDSGADD